MNNRIISLLLFIISCLQVFSQAGTGVYQFLGLPASSRLAAMGSTNVSLRDNDINFAFQNPALLTAETHNNLGLNMANYLADIQFGSAIYGRNLGNNNYLGFGIQYVDYGIFKETTETNEFLGEFTAKDYAISLIYARPINDKISIGATLKPVYSVFERYTSYGLAMDAGVSYNNPKQLFSVGLVFRNMGTQFKGYYTDEDGQHIEPLPFDIQLGFSKKFTHAPLRFSLTFVNLQQIDLSFRSTNQATELLNSTSTNTDISMFDMAFRHAIIAVEFVPSKNFYLTASYNHGRQQEMRMTGFKSAAGFSFGGGIKIYKFHVGFSRSQLQVGNYSNQFSITTALNEFRL